MKVKCRAEFLLSQRAQLLQLLKIKSEMAHKNDGNNLQFYLSTVKLFEDFESSFHETVDFAVVNQKLQQCLMKINYLISTETDDSIRIVALSQLQCQFNLMINVWNNSAVNKNSKTSISSSKNVNNNSDNHSKSNEGNIEVVQKRKLSNDIIESTLEVPKVNGFSEIIGLKNVLKMLKSLVILPKLQPQLFENCRNLSNSILLYGPPGTGKTRLVHALAAEAKAQLHCISASDLLSHYVGQTEKTIKVLFNYIKTNENFTILFIDEIDGLCRKRSQNEHDHTRRIKTEFMCQLSNMEEYKNVFIVSATNCPWDLDKAILRRFQKRIHISLPNRIERFEFFQYFTKSEHLTYNLDDWNLLLDKTDNCSGSDLYNIVQNALLIPVNELEDTKIWKCTNDGMYEPISSIDQQTDNIICSDLQNLPKESVRTRKIRVDDFLTVIDNFIFTITKDDLRKFENFNGK